MRGPDGFNFPMQKQNSSSVSGRAVDLAHTLMKAKSPFANILYSELGQASQQAKFHLPGEIQTCNFLVCRWQPDLKRNFCLRQRAAKRRICKALEAAHIHCETTLKSLMQNLTSQVAPSAPLPTLLTSSARRAEQAETKSDTS